MGRDYDYFGTSAPFGNARANKTASELQYMPADDAAQWRFSLTYEVGGGSPSTLYFRSRQDRDAFHSVFAALQSFVLREERDQL